MATVKGVNQTLVDAGGESTIGGGYIKVRQKVIKDSYALTTANLSGEVIKLFGKLTPGAVLQSIVLDVSAGQTGLTISVGDLASSTRYANADTGLQSAISLKTYNRLVIPCGQYVVGTATNDDQIILTTGGATATAGTLYAELTYTAPAE
jgi:hypothetical protein